MGIKDKLFGKRVPQEVTLPPMLQPEDPVNYNTVLEWLLGLSDKDYKTMQEVVGIYREARKSETKLLKITEQPTSQLLAPAETDDEIDAGLDKMLDAHPDDLKAAMESDNKTTAAKKANKKK